MSDEFEKWWNAYQYLPRGAAKDDARAAFAAGQQSREARIEELTDELEATSAVVLEVRARADAAEARVRELEAEPLSATDVERLRREGEALRKEIERRVGPMKQGPFLPPKSEGEKP